MQNSCKWGILKLLQYFCIEDESTQTKESGIEAKYFTLRQRRYRQEDNKLFILIATPQQRISNQKQCIFSYISLPIHDKKIIKCSYTMLQRGLHDLLPEHEDDILKFN